MYYKNMEKTRTTKIENNDVLRLVKSKSILKNIYRKSGSQKILGHYMRNSNYNHNERRKTEKRQKLELVGIKRF